MKRNSCKSSWASRFDIRILFGIPLGHNVSRLDVCADVTNLFRTAFKEPSNIDRGLEVPRLAGRVGDDPNGALIYDYRGPRADDDFSFARLRTRASAMEAQFGVRWMFL